MASSQGVAKVLRFLHALYPAHEVTDETGEAWLVVFADLPDDALADAARRCASEAGRKFFPTVGEVRAVVDAMTGSRVNPTTLLRQIESMGSYNAHCGWVWPRVESVRERFGDGVATAYGMVGPGRFASEDAVTRDIAARDFAQDVRTVAVERPTRPTLPPAPMPDVVRQLAAKMDATSTPTEAPDATLQ
jgi:hypothetical protein